MDLQDIRKTDIWQLYEKGRDYCRLHNVYTDTDRNHRFYNGNQWEGAKLGDVEPVQKNFIKPIVKYKVAVIHDNLYAVVFSSQNFESTAFREEADKYNIFITYGVMNVIRTSHGSNVTHQMVNADYVQNAEKQENIVMRVL